MMTTLLFKSLVDTYKFRNAVNKTVFLLCKQGCISVNGLVQFRSDPLVSELVDTESWHTTAGVSKIDVTVT